MSLKTFGFAVLCALGATSAVAQPWTCQVWQWHQSAKLSFGSFTVDPAKIETQQIAIDQDTTAQCTGQMARSATTAQLVCSISTESTHTVARGFTMDDGNYLLTSANRTDLLIDNQIECSPAGQAKH